MLSIGTKLALVSAQTGDNIKLLRRITRKYISRRNTGRELVEERILKSETEVKPLDKMGTGAELRCPAANKKAPDVSRA
jgi:hypothetical protein